MFYAQRSKAENSLSTVCLIECEPASLSEALAGPPGAGRGRIALALSTTGLYSARGFRDFPAKTSCYPVGRRCIFTFSYRTLPLEG